MNRKGMAIPLVLVSIVMLFLVFAGLMMYSRGEVHNIDRTYKRMKAQYIAEAGAAAATAQIFGNDFEKRFYKGQQQGPWGYVGQMKADFNGGEYTVVCEDITNPVKDPAKEFTKATYNRIDLFSRGTCDGVSVVIYKALILHPEEKIYSWKTRNVEQADGKTMTEYYDIQVR